MHKIWLLSPLVCSVFSLADLLDSRWLPNKTGTTKKSVSPAQTRGPCHPLFFSRTRLSQVLWAKMTGPLRAGVSASARQETRSLCNPPTASPVPQKMKMYISATSLLISIKLIAFVGKGIFYNISLSYWPYLCFGETSLNI